MFDLISGDWNEPNRLHRIYTATYVANKDDIVRMRPESKFGSIATISREGNWPRNLSISLKNTNQKYAEGTTAVYVHTHTGKHLNMDYPESPMVNIQ